MLKAILWDMDGTLVDSEPLWAKATFEMSEEIGRRIPPEVQALTVGGTFDNTLDICINHAGVTLTPAERAKHQHTLYSRVTELFASELQLIDGIAELLTELQHDNIPMMIVTNTPRALADPAMEAIGKQNFNGTICGDEVNRGKPDPEIYATAAARLGVAPEDCLVFEDSAAGMTAAAAAGCAVVGLPHDPTMVLPRGVVKLADLKGDASFLGVTAADVRGWFSEIRARQGEDVEQ
ncbi:HAD family phosphatase [Staphylococcus chromogenes]|nr:HAD family phosphatase [Staphylococcus chromogenes]